MKKRKTITDLKIDVITRNLKNNFGVDHWNGKFVRILDQKRNPIYNVQKNLIEEMIIRDLVKIVYKDTNFNGYYKVYLLK